MRSTVVLVVLVSVLLLACQPQAPPDTRAADEQAIRDTYAECLKASQAKDLERVLSCWADDGSVFPPNAPIATGKEAIRPFYSELYTNPGFALSSQQTKVEVSHAGDLAYDVGAYELTLNDPQGKPVTDRGKFVHVWKKQPDGSWKAVVAIFNSDQPAPGTATP